MGQVTIRRAQPKDYPEVISMSLAMKDDEEALGYTGYASDEQFATGIAGMLIDEEGNPTKVLLVAEVGKDLVGFIMGYVHSMSPLSRFSTGAFCEALYVAPEHRTDKVATQICFAFQDEVKALGAGFILGTMYQANTLTQFGLLGKGFRYEFVQLMKEI